MRLQSDADYDEITRQAIATLDMRQLLTLIGAPPQYTATEFAHCSTDAYAWALGNFRHRASVLLDRAEAAEKRIAQLEAEATPRTSLPDQQEATPGTSLPDQRQQIAIRLGAAGHKGRDAKLAFCSIVARRPITSSTELSYLEAAEVLRQAAALPAAT